MTGDELKSQAIAWFGTRGWQTKLSALLGMDRTALWRQIQNDAVSGPVSAAVTAWQRHGLPNEAGGAVMPLHDPRPMAPVLADWMARHALEDRAAVAAFLLTDEASIAGWLQGDAVPQAEAAPRRALMTMVDEGRLAPPMA